jgi:signal transduction histidine kinase
VVGPFVSGTPAAFLMNLLRGVVAMAAPCALLAVGSRRTDLPRRLRRSLRLFASAYGVAILLAIIGLASSGRLIPAPPAALPLLLMLAIYALVLSATLALPLERVGPGDRRRVALDVGVAAGGLILVQMAAITLPGLSALSDAAAATLVVYMLAQALQILAVTIVVVRGVALPSARATAGLVAALATGGIVLGVAQVLVIGRVPDGRIVQAGYLLASYFTLAAGAFVLTDPVEPLRRRVAPSLVRLFNPLPALVVLVVALAPAFLPQDRAGERAYAVGSSALLVVLLLRVYTAASETARLREAEAQRVERERIGTLEAVGGLAGGLAHHFNNLLTVVQGHLHLAREDGAASRNLDEIQQAADRVAAITNQLLLYSGRQFDLRQPHDVVATVQAIVRQLQASMPSSIQVRLEAPSAPISALVDRRQLAVLLDELVKNARDAMPSGGVVRIGVERETLRDALASPYLPARPGEYVRIDVVDGGIGIGVDVLPRIFEPFVATGGSHVGLGLPAVLGIVRAHGGGITVASTPGTGTQVSVYLPVLRPGGSPGGLPWDQV